MHNAECTPSTQIKTKEINYSIVRGKNEGLNKVLKY